MTTSIVDWPGSASTLAFYSEYIQPFPQVYGNKFGAYGELQKRVGNMTPHDSVAQIKSINLIPKNFIQLNIAFLTQNYQVNADMAAVGWETLFSNLGGALNLWMGITILFAAEVIEFLVAIGSLCFSHLRQPHQQEGLPGENSPDPVDGFYVMGMVTMSGEQRVNVMITTCEDSENDTSHTQETQSVTPKSDIQECVTPKSDTQE